MHDKILSSLLCFSHLFWMQHHLPIFIIIIVKKRQVLSHLKMNLGHVHSMLKNCENSVNFIQMVMPENVLKMSFSKMMKSQ